LHESLERNEWSLKIQATVFAIVFKKKRRKKKKKRRNEKKMMIKKKSVWA